MCKRERSSPPAPFRPASQRGMGTGNEDFPYTRAGAPTHMRMASATAVGASIWT